MPNGTYGGVRERDKPALLDSVYGYGVFFRGAQSGAQPKIFLEAFRFIWYNK